jgi:predicted ATPase
MESPMIKAIRFKNFKALRDTELPLGRVTVIVGANGTGKSTALASLGIAKKDFGMTPSAGILIAGGTETRIELEWGEDFAGFVSQRTRTSKADSGLRHLGPPGAQIAAKDTPAALQKLLESVRVYSLDAGKIPLAVRLEPVMSLTPEGGNLAGVLDRLRDTNPERFDSLNEELCRWLPEFDRILFDTPSAGQRAIKLRTRVGQQTIRAADLSQGTLIALAILTLAYLPNPPPIVGLEEPDRGIHPRLLRQVQDAIYRLAYPESCDETRKPVQIIATTHSPYLLDLFRDHLEEVVIAEKLEGNVKFSRLSDMPNAKEILGDASLGEVWYSGILGGVSTTR